MSRNGSSDTPTAQANQPNLDKIEVVEFGASISEIPVVERVNHPENDEVVYEVELPDDRFSVRIMSGVLQSGSHQKGPARSCLWDKESEELHPLECPKYDIEPPAEECFESLPERTQRKIKQGVNKISYIKEREI